MNKNVHTLTKFAQFEHDHGSIERGRTMFNTLLESNPKRSDLLFLHVVKEIKEDHIDKACAILQHVILSIVDQESKAFKHDDAINVPAATNTRRTWMQNNMIHMKEKKQYECR